MHNPYGLDFCALHAATAEPKPSSDLHTQRERQSTLEQLATLGVSHCLLALTCQVEPKSIERWLDEGVTARSTVARRALDRLGPIIIHMREDLALDDVTIGDFMQNQTKRPPAIPVPLIAWAGRYITEQPKLTEEHESRDGLFAMESRLRSLYAPRYQDLPQHPPIRTPS